MATVEPTQTIASQSEAVAPVVPPAPATSEHAAPVVPPVLIAVQSTLYFPSPGLFVLCVFDVFHSCVESLPKGSFARFYVLQCKLGFFRLHEELPDYLSFRLHQFIQFGHALFREQVNCLFFHPHF
jgi:hypothetical protein